MVNEDKFGTQVNSLITFSKTDGSRLSRWIDWSCEYFEKFSVSEEKKSRANGFDKWSDLIRCLFVWMKRV